MDNIDNGTTHTISPHHKNPGHFKDISTPSDSEADSSKNRHCVSLPLYYDQVRYYTLSYAISFIIKSRLPDIFFIPFYLT